MDIKNVIIAGDGELPNRIQELASKCGLRATISSSSFPDADMVIEAISGTIVDRKHVLGTANKQANKNTIITTTSPANVTELAATIQNPARFAGLHFTFNTFQNKVLVQIVNCLETSKETIATCKQFVEKIGGIAVVVEDSPGLILDRMMALVINEAAIMYSTKLATIEDIDRTTKLCLNWPMGPFEFADVIGIDTVVVTLNTLSQNGYQVAPCRLLKGMVDMGKLGKKTGKGFYTYNQ